MSKAMVRRLGEKSNAKSAADPVKKSKVFRKVERRKMLRSQEKNNSRPFGEENVSQLFCNLCNLSPTNVCIAPLLTSYNAHTFILLSCGPCCKSRFFAQKMFWALKNFLDLKKRKLSALLPKF